MDAARCIEFGIQEAYDGDGPAVDMAHAAARGVLACVRDHLAFQSRFEGTVEIDRVRLVAEVAAIIREAEPILSNRTTSLMSSTATALSGKDQQDQKQLATLKELFEKKDTIERLRAVAPKYVTVERLIRLLLSAGSRNPKIINCTQQSVLLFAMKCAETGLEPIGAGGCYPIPRKNKHTGAMELTFLPDYRGLMNCAKHAGCITDGFAEVVYANDHFEYELGLTQTIKHKPARTNRGELEAAYCVLVMPDQSRRAVVMQKEDIENIRNQSSEAWRSDGNTPWKTYPAEMWKKTVVRRAMKPFAGYSASLFSAMDDEGEDRDGDMTKLPQTPEKEPEQIAAPDGEKKSEPEKKIKKASAPTVKAIIKLFDDLDVPFEERVLRCGGAVDAMPQDAADILRGELESDKAKLG